MVTEKAKLKVPSKEISQTYNYGENQNVLYDYGQSNKNLVGTQRPMPSPVFPNRFLMIMWKKRIRVNRLELKAKER